MGDKRVFIKVWGQGEGRYLENKVSLGERLYALVAEIPSKTPNSTGKKKVWPRF